MTSESSVVSMGDRSSGLNESWFNWRRTSERPPPSPRRDAQEGEEAKAEATIDDPLADAWFR
jgi:hypothetical protein